MAISDEEFDKVSKSFQNALSKAMTASLRDLKKELDKDSNPVGNAFGEGLSRGLNKNIPKLKELNFLFKSSGAVIATLAAAIVDAGFKVDKQVTDLARSMGSTKTEALLVRDSLYDIAANSGDAFMNTERLVNSLLKLQKGLGISQMFSGDIVTEFTRLTEKIRLSEESSLNLSRISIAFGRQLKDVTNEAFGTARAMAVQNNLLFNERDILDKVGQISGQLLSNFRGSTKSLTEAVYTTERLGTTLQQTKQQGEALLNFESSLEKQLKAQLLTGQQLNLERARGLALQGKHEEVAKELANQNMNYYKFSRLNVLQQNAFADAIGLSSDALSDQLLKQQFYGKSVAEVTALTGEEVANRYAQLNAQERFNNAIEKLQDIFTRLMGGAAGRFLELLADKFGEASSTVSQQFGTSQLSPTNQMTTNTNPTMQEGYFVNANELADKIVQGISKVELRPQVDVVDLTRKQLQIARK